MNDPTFALGLLDFREIDGGGVRLRSPTGLGNLWNLISLDPMKINDRWVSGAEPHRSLQPKRAFSALVAQQPLLV
jgi:hypothetical protein